MKNYPFFSTKIKNKKNKTSYQNGLFYPQMMIFLQPDIFCTKILKNIVDKEYRKNTYKIIENFFLHKTIDAQYQTNQFNNKNPINTQSFSNQFNKQKSNGLHTRIKPSQNAKMKIPLPILSSNKHENKQEKPNFQNFFSNAQNAAEIITK